MKFGLLKLKKMFWKLPYSVRYNLFGVIMPRKRNLYNKMKFDVVGLVSFRDFIKYKTIFVHIPKAAGLSFNTALFGHHGGGHIPLRNYQFVFKEKEFNKYFKFTIVRNPWSRIYSAYNFLRKGGITENDRKFAQLNILKYETFECFVLDWINEVNIYNGIHFIPQYEFVCDHNGKLIVDYVGYFEDLSNEFSYIKNRLGIDSELLHMNGINDFNDYKLYYTTEMIKKVEKVYKKDIELFDFKF